MNTKNNKFNRKKNISENQNQEIKKDSIIADIKSVIDFFYIKNVPSYGNNFFFTIGVYLLELFGILAVSGIIMVIFGPYWWNLTSIGSFVGSIHLWAAEAFVTLILIHLFVQFSTSSFKHKKLVWMLGSLLLMLVFLEYAFGIGVQGGLVSQWNAKAGADLWNGLGLGYWINPLNAGAVLGWHIAIAPLVLIGLLFFHYMIVKKKGLSTPYRKDIPYSIVPANHKIMYKRMVYVFVIILIFAFFLRAPYIPSLTIQTIAQQHPNIMAITLLNEFNQTSHTATYLDSIDPYTFNTASVYVVIPYMDYINSSYNSQNNLEKYFAENSSIKNENLNSAFAYFNNNGSAVNAVTNSSNPLLNVVGSVVKLAQSGAYQALLQNEVASGLNYTYTIRFLSDTRVLQSIARSNNLRTSQLGMIKTGSKWWQIGSYWILPYNYLEILTNKIPWWGDLENGTFATSIFVIFLFLPYIPYLRDIPDKLKLYKIFWNKYTIPELKNKKK